MFDRPILYSFRRCPYAMRARMTLMQAGIQCELREVVLRDKPAEMIALSPKATVPVLQLAEDQILEESLDIMRWALAINDPDGWLEPEADIAALITRLDGDFKDSLDRYKYFVNYPEQPQSVYRAQGEIFLQSLEDRLATHDGQGLCDRRITFADIACFPFVRQFAFVDKPWFDQAPYPLLKEWLNRHLESDLFLSVMTKYAPWKPGDGVVFFGSGPAVAP